MAIDCNDIHTVADALKEKFTPCYKLTAEDMDTVVELIEAVEVCVSTGAGFMTTSIYDINASNIVDDSELVNGLTVETAVPAGAVFTDTLYDDSGVEPSLGNPSINGQVLSSTTVGVRSWVTTVAGGGDMTVAVYDTNGNNVVDNSELVNGLTVETAVPSGAIFTDTVYDDTALQATVAGKEDSLLNPGTDGYILSSTIAGVRTWVVPTIGITNLSFVAAATVGTITSDTGTNAIISLADVTNSGLLAPADFTLLGNTSGINSGDSDTNLSYTTSPTNGVVTSSDGTDATLPLADGTNAGLLKPVDFVTLGNQSGVNTGDQSSLHILASPSDEDISGMTVSLQVGENIGFGDVLYMKLDGKLWKADSNGTDTYPVIGIASEVILADATGKILLNGIATDLTWTWTIGKEVFLSETPGLMTQTRPAQIGDTVQVIGVSIHTNRVLFNPNMIDTIQSVVDITPPAIMTFTSVTEQ